MRRIALTLVLPLALIGLLAEPDTARTITGIVTAPDGTPLAGAVVTLTEGAEGPLISVLTGPDGRFALEETPGAGAALAVRRAGFEPTRIALTATRDLEVVLPTARDEWETASSAAFLALLPDGEVKRRFKLDCTGCHQFDRVTVEGAGGGFETEAGWEEHVTRMLGFAGASSQFPIISPARHPAETARWLARHLPPGSRPPIRDVPWTAAPGAAEITEYPLPVPQDLPHDLIVGPDGRVVITGMMTHRMYVLDPATGAFDSVPIPTRFANPRAVEVSREGTWWVLLGFPRQVGRLAPGGVWRTWDIGMYPHSIGVDAEERVWFNGHFTRDPELLAWLDPATGRVTRYEVPTPSMPDTGSTIPYELRVAGNGTVWVTQLVGNRLVRFDPDSEQFRLYDLPIPHSGPRRIDVDPDGVVWIPEYAANRLSRFDPEREAFEAWEVPIPDALPYVVRIDAPRGRVWIGTAAADAIIRFDPAVERFLIYPLPSRDALIRHMDIDRETGDVWAAYGPSPAREPVKVVRLRVPDGGS